MPKQKVSKEDEFKLQVNDLLSEEQELQRTATELAQSNPRFIDFLKKQQDFKNKSDIFWKTLETDMIANNVKSIKSPAWGSITIAEKTTFKGADFDKIPKKFFKKAIDTKKVGAYKKLTGKLPAGIKAEDTKYLTKRINIKEINEE